MGDAFRVISRIRVEKNRVYLQMIYIYNMIMQSIKLVHKQG